MTVFDVAKAKAPTTTAKVKKSEVETVEVKGLEPYASLVALDKAIEAVQKTIKAQLTVKMNEKFIADGMLRGARPDNYKGTEGLASASLQLKINSSRSVISDENVKRLEEKGIPLKTLDEVTETFIINPDYLENEALMKRVSDALELAGIPDDFIQHQCEKKRVADAKSLDAVFALKSREDVEALLPLVATTAILPTTKATITKCFETVAELLKPEEETETEEAAK